MNTENYTPPGFCVGRWCFGWNVLQKWVRVGWGDGRFIAVALENRDFSQKTIKTHTKHCVVCAFTKIRK
ncbi:MAG: hypothetical protein FWH05_06345 [Oscillospiraceae bacterium]|nr:hypothetical protein [Oscillospiraceae bacterium]